MRRHRAGDHRIRDGPENAALRRQLLSFQRPEHHYLLPEPASETPVYGDRQVGMHARVFPVSHVFRTKEKALRLIVARFFFLFLYFIYIFINIIFFSIFLSL